MAKTLIFDDEFLGTRTYSSSVATDGWLYSSDGSAAITHATAGTAGAAQITLSGDATPAYLALHFGDILCFDIDTLRQIEIKAKVASLGADSIAYVGVTSAHNATADDVAQSAWFRIDGTAGTIYVETDDATNETSLIPTGQELSSAYKTLKISFARGKSDVRFYIDDVRVAASTAFDMSGYAGSFQPYIRLGRAESADASVLSVEDIKIYYKNPE